MPCACVSPALMLSCPARRAGAGPTLPALTVRFLLAERTCQHDLSLKTQQDVAADSNTPELIEPSSQGSPEALLPPEPVQSSSPSLLCSYSSTSLAETGTAWAASAACDAPCPARGLQVSGGYQATLLSLSPVFPVLPSSRLQSLPEAMPHREQAVSSGTAFPPDPLKHSPSRAGTQGGDAVGAKRKLLAGDDQALPALGGQQHPQGATWHRGKDTGRRLEPASTPAAKKSRKEEVELRRGEELEEEGEEQATAASGPSSRPEQRRALQPVKMKQLFPLGGWSLRRSSVSCPLPASVPKAFPHPAGGDGWLKAGLNVGGGSSPPKGGSGALGEDVVEPTLGGSQHWSILQLSR